MNLKCDNILKQKIFKFGVKNFSAYITSECCWEGLYTFDICPEDMILI